VHTPEPSARVDRRSRRLPGDSFWTSRLRRCAASPLVYESSVSTADVRRSTPLIEAIPISFDDARVPQPDLSVVTASTKTAKRIASGFPWSVARDPGPRASPSPNPFDRRFYFAARNLLAPATKNAAFDASVGVVVQLESAWPF